MELYVVKILSAAGLFAVTFFMTLLPLFLFKKARFNRDEFTQSDNFRIISFLSCFGGGVFFGTCLLHLFPEVEEQMDRIFTNFNIVPNYPVAEFLLGFGFLAILIVEQIVLNCQEHSCPSVNSAEPNSNHRTARDVQTQPENNSETGGLVSNQVSPAPNYGTMGDPVAADSEDEDDTDLPAVVTFPDVRSGSLLRSLLLLLALSLHAVFEGLAIGLQTSAQAELRILVAVLIHKSIIAFTLGLQLTSALRARNAVRSGAFFAATSPCGILVGTAVVDFAGEGLPMLITSGVLQGLAAGTFLYVTLFEVIPNELRSGKDRMVKMACVVLGYSVVSLLLTFLPE